MPMILINTDELSPVAESEVLAIMELRAEERRKTRAERKSPQVKGVVRGPAPSEPTGYVVRKGDVKVSDGKREPAAPRFVRARES